MKLENNDTKYTNLALILIESLRNEKDVIDSVKLNKETNEEEIENEETIYTLDLN
jgi:hypothetical protein